MIGKNGLFWLFRQLLSPLALRLGAWVWLFALAAPAWSKSPLPTMSLEEARFRKEHIAQRLKHREGYNNKVWDEWIRMAPRYEDPEIVFQLLGAEIPAGFVSTQYRLDIYKTFSANPSFFVKASNRFYQGNLDCLIRLLVPPTQFIAFDELDGRMKESLASGSDTELLEQFKAKAESYYARLNKDSDAESTLSIAHCLKP